MLRIRPPRTLGDHLAGDGLGRDDRAAHVEVHDPVPVGAGIRFGGVEHLARAAAHGVDQDVDATELRDGLANQSVAVGLVGRVGDDGQALPADRLDLGRARVE